MTKEWTYRVYKNGKYLFSTKNPATKKDAIARGCTVKKEYGPIR